jgi:hypothetical protein
MAWSGSICDQETARKAAGCILAGQNVLGVLAASLSSVAVAQAAAVTLEATKSVCDRIYASNCSRAYKVASNLSGTFSSSYTTLYASLPDSALHQRMMING